MNDSVFGRDQELAAITRFLGAIEARPQVCILEGGPGIGKTTVWRAAIARAADIPLTILQCRPVESESKLAFASLGDLLEPVGDPVLAALPEPQRVALEVALLRRSPTGASPDHRAIGAALGSVVRRLTDERALLIAIDDAQWMDSSSAATLAFMLRRLSDEPVSLLVAARIETHARWDPLDVERSMPDRVERIPVGPIGLNELHHVISTRLGLVLSRPTLHQVMDASAGNPLFAIELVRTMINDGREPGHGEPLPVPRTLAALLSERVLALPDRTRAALLVAASMPAPTTETVAGVVGEDAHVALMIARQAGVVDIDVDRIIFTHPLLASTIAELAPAAQRRLLHLRLAELAAGPEERAHHLALGAVVPDEAVALAIEHGAVAARARGGQQAAAVLFDRAQSLTPPGHVVAMGSRALQAAAAHVAAGDRGQARAGLEGVLAGKLPRPIRAEALRLLAEIFNHDENLAGAEELLRDALEYVDHADAAARVELDLLYIAMLSGDYPSAAEFGGKAVAHLEESTDRSFLSEALAYRTLATFLCGGGVDHHALDRSLALEDRRRANMMGLPPRAVAALILLFEGRHTGARDILGEVRVALGELGMESDLAHALLWLAWLETRTGHYQRAAEVAEEAGATAEMTGSALLHRWSLAQQALVLAHRGDLAGAVERAQQARPLDHHGNRAADLWLAATVALVGLTVGDHATAWEACRPVVEAVEAHGVGEPALLFFLPEAIEALAALGHLGRAEALVNVFGARGLELDRVWAIAAASRCRGVVSAAGGDLDGALAALIASVEQHERLDMPFDLARTLLLLGGVQRRRRQRRAAKDTCERAHAIFLDIGAQAWADRAAEELNRIPIRHQATGELTAAERRVAEHAGAGRTNREVAATLFVSPKTVEANLSRIYAKLGISSRAELGAWLSRNGQPDDSSPKT